MRFGAFRCVHDVPPLRTPGFAVKFACVLRAVCGSPTETATYRPFLCAAHTITSASSSSVISSLSSIVAQTQLWRPTTSVARACVCVSVCLVHTTRRNSHRSRRAHRALRRAITNRSRIGRQHRATEKKTTNTTYTQRKKSRAGGQQGHQRYPSESSRVAGAPQRVHICVYIVACTFCVKNLYSAHVYV